MKSIKTTKIMIIQETTVKDIKIPKLPNKGILVLDLTKDVVLFS